MYFASLPDHTASTFDEQAHFRKFKLNNIVFHAKVKQGYCEQHVGCLSIKAVLKGEERYGIGARSLCVRPGQFLILNNDQSYSYKVETSEETEMLSVFFKTDFAAAVLLDAMKSEAELLDSPFDVADRLPEFFQTLYHTDSSVKQTLNKLIALIHQDLFDEAEMDESFFELLNHLIRAHTKKLRHASKIEAVKPSTRHEIFKRLCIARDMLHSHYMEKTDLAGVCRAASISMPQLIRQFKAVFRMTPHQYLSGIRIANAARLLQKTNLPVQEITWMCGFENASAFCRVFKSAYGTQPINYRIRHN